MSAPAGMVEVTKVDFFRVMGPRNVHPRSEPTRSVWYDLATHKTLGISTPGYRSAQGVPAAYFILKELL